MDFGVTWDNEYVSLHMLDPDYQPMVGYPLSHTRGTDGRQVAQAVIVELQVRSDLAKYRGTLKGKAVLVHAARHDRPGAAHQRRPAPDAGGARGAASRR